MKGGILEEPHATAAATRTTRTRRSYLKLFTALFVAAVYARLFYVSIIETEKKMKLIRIPRY